MPRLPEGWTIEPGTGRMIRVLGRSCTVLDFMDRLSEDEQLALMAVRMDPDTPFATRVALALLVEQRDNTSNKRIEFDDPRTQRGVDVALAVLSALPAETPGRIDPADVATRKAAWLADYPQPGEGA